MLPCQSAAMSRLSHHDTSKALCIAEGCVWLIICNSLSGSYSGAVAVLLLYGVLPGKCSPSEALSCIGRDWGIWIPRRIWRSGQNLWAPQGIHRAPTSRSGVLKTGTLEAPAAAAAEREG